MVSRLERRMKKGRTFFNNGPEDQAACLIHRREAEFTKRGYPDITVYNSDGSIYGFIEVKPRRDMKLKETQQKFLDFCEKLNIPCIRWSPDEGEDKVLKFVDGRS